jgi:DNA invertase Pin-like site-specific DNA recombinase
MNAHVGATSGNAKTIHCAIYTRKSSDDGLEQEFNSLDAQYEACVAYVASQRHESWKLIPDRFDDGGLSGGTMDRPGLQRLLAEIDAGRIGMVVVYKIDRLTRSLADFARLVERLEAKGCSFVSVTQAFNTSSSMGRLTLNVLLSFAQFEREVTAERIRDKIAASKKKGLWMGGSLPLGYDRPKGPTAARVLQVNPGEADTVRALFALYAELGSLRLTREAALAQGLSPRKANHLPDQTARPIAAFSNGQLHYLLTNPVYRGLIRHRVLVHPGQHAAIIDEAVWDQVQARLMATAARKRTGSSTSRDVGHGTENQEPIAPLIGRVFDETGDRLTPSHTNRHNRRFRYYVSRRLMLGKSDPTGWRLPAEAFEQTVLDALRQHLRARGTRHDLTLMPDASQADRVAAELQRLAQAEDALLWPLIGKVQIAPGNLNIPLDPAAMAASAGVDITSVNPASLHIEQPFQRRRRGVETRIVTGMSAPHPDPVLQQNLARAHQWAAQIRAGKSITDIARREGHAESYVRTRLTLAFLAPAIQRAILGGTIGPEWTTDRVLQAHLPLDWAEQTRRIGL